MKIGMINKMFAKIIREKGGKEIKGETEGEGRRLIFGDQTRVRAKRHDRWYIISSVFKWHYTRIIITERFLSVRQP